MSTLNEMLCRKLIENNGYCAEGARVTKVVTYTNQWGDKSWAALYEHHDQMKYENSSACRNVKVEWGVS